MTNKKIKLVSTAIFFTAILSLGAQNINALQFEEETREDIQQVDDINETNNYYEQKNEDNLEKLSDAASSKNNDSGKQDNEDNLEKLSNNISNKANDYLDGETSENLVETNNDNYVIDFNINIIGNPIFADSLCDILQGLPIGIKEFLYQNGLNVILAENEYGAEEAWYDFTGEYISSITGATFKEDDYIEIFVESSMHTGDYEIYSDISSNFSEEEFNFIIARNTLIHELGHFFDARYDYGLSDCDSFYEIYFEEVNNYLNTKYYNVDNLKIYANVSTPREYFATAYSSYLVYPENLRKYCPKTYDYIYGIMKSIEETYTFEKNR
ncbi:MAG: hypothetical protein IKG40_03780 [Bacilli bacterium]|nr:hypothetical protein [Bacilli bacterium]